MGLRHVPLYLAGSGLFRRKAGARTVPSPYGRLALTLALVGPARHRLRRCCSSFVRVRPNDKRVHRLYCEESLSLRRKRRKRLRPHSEFARCELKEAA